MKKTKDFNSKMHVGADPVSAHTSKARLNNGITLIALIITIIVMLILVSVTISMAINGGLFEYAGKSVSDTENAINKEQELAGGEVQIDGEWYDSIDDFLAGVESVKSLQEKHEFTYYSSLGKAVTDVNNNTRENADADKENAVAGIYNDENGKPVVVLLKDTTEETRIQPSVDMAINLGGYTLSSNDAVCIESMSGNITIDGRLKGSTIYVSHTDGRMARPIQVRTGNFTVNGGNYIGDSKGAAGGGCIFGAGNITLSGIKVSYTETSRGATGVMVVDGGTLNILNCDISAKSNDNEAWGIWAGGSSATISNCKVLAYSNTNDIAVGIRNAQGNLLLNNCNVKGIRTGIENYGTLTVNGGTYEGVEAGGFLFRGEGTTSYVKNATIRECEMPEGYTSTIASNNTGFYIGGSSTGKNIKVYMDNCDIYGSKNPINMVYGSNNALYISNSKINTDKQISIADGHKLYLGKGNNFTADNTNNPTAVEKTEEVYVQE